MIMQKMKHSPIQFSVYVLKSAFNLYTGQ